MLAWAMAGSHCRPAIVVLAAAAAACWVPVEVPQARVRVIKSVGVTLGQAFPPIPAVSEAVRHP